IPLDQRRPRTERLERIGVERPYGLADSRAVIVDAQHPASRELAHGVPREVELADLRGRQRGEVALGVEAVVAGADVDVVDVAEDAAASARRDRGDEFPL